VHSNKESLLFRNWIIQQSDNVVIDGYESENGPRFFVISDPMECYTMGGEWVSVSCYFSGDSDYEVSKTYYKKIAELKRI